MLVNNAAATSINKSKKSLINYESPKKVARGLSLFFLGKASLKRKRKKAARKKYRFFIDNIIMHHRRLHQRNRDVVLDKIKLLEKEKRKQKSASLSLDMNRKLSIAQAKSSQRVKKHIMREARKKQIAISGINFLSKEKSKFSVRTL